MAFQAQRSFPAGYPAQRFFRFPVANALPEHHIRPLRRFPKGQQKIAVFIVIACQPCHAARFHLPEIRCHFQRDVCFPQPMQQRVGSVHLGQLRAALHPHASVRLQEREAFRGKPGTHPRLVGFHRRIRQEFLLEAGGAF